MNIIFIDCSEKNQSTINKITDFCSSYYKSKNISCKILKLKNMQISSCTSCRVCNQKDSSSNVSCFLKDDMDSLINEIKKADAYVIIKDQNGVFTTNIIYKTFNERLAGFYYWPYGMNKKILRNPKIEKNSVLITYNTTKKFAGHSSFTTKVQLNSTAKVLGSKVLHSLIIKPSHNLLINYQNSLIKICDTLLEQKELKKQTEDFNFWI